MSYSQADYMVSVSVVIPTADRAALVSRAIKSVLAQDYTDFELIIVDDCSNDNTKEIIGIFCDRRIVYIKHACKRGANAARNTGIKAAKGKYVAFLDDDDEWCPTKLSKQVKKANESSDNIGVIYTGFIKIDNQTVRRIVLPLYKGNIFDKLLTGNYVNTTSTVLVKRGVFDKVGLFDEELLSLQDWDMWLRIATTYQFTFVHEPLVFNYTTKMSISTNLSKQIQGYSRLLGKYGTYLSPKLKSLYYLRLGELLCLNGNMRDGRNYIFKSYLDDKSNLNCVFHYLLSLAGHIGFTKLHTFLQESILPDIFGQSHISKTALGYLSGVRE